MLIFLTELQNSRGTADRTKGSNNHIHNHTQRWLRPHSVTGRKLDKKKGKDTEDLSKSTKHLDLSRADRTLRPTTAEHMRFHQDTPCAGPKHKPQ